jgi:hypothetical protein
VDVVEVGAAEDLARWIANVWVDGASRVELWRLGAEGAACAEGLPIANIAPHTWFEAAVILPRTMVDTIAITGAHLGTERARRAKLAERHRAWTRMWSMEEASS